MHAHGFTLWFTGLSQAGKSTICNLVGRELRARGETRMEILDGDMIRTNLSKGLGFSREDRDENIHRIAFVANLLTRNGVATLVAAISPYRDTRDNARSMIGAGAFIEVYTKASVETCVERDTKGLYEKAIKGEIKEFTGISDPYEEPLSPELVIDTENEEPRESAEKVINYLIERGYVTFENSAVTGANI